MASTRNQRGRARAAVIPFPRARGRIDVVRFAPSRASIAVGCAIVVAAAAAYAGARETKLFAVHEVAVAGAPSPVAAEVRRALVPVVGESIVALDAAAVEARVAALPTVVSAEIDRAYPHGLAVFVTPEQPAAVVRRGRESWLVSERGRALASLRKGARPLLPRIWIRGRAPIRPGGFVTSPAVAAATAVLRPLATDPLPARVRTVRADGELTLVLRTGVEVRLGSAEDLQLKLAVARRLLPVLRGRGYADLSVPERPVARTNPQVEG